MSGKYHVISTHSCTFCKEAINLLEREDIPFEVTYLEDEPWLKTLFLMTSETHVPQIFTDTGVHVGGYTELKQYVSK